MSSVANSLRSFSRDDIPAVLELSRRALARPEEHVGNPLWATMDELESELADWDEPPEATLLVDAADGVVVGFGGVEVAKGFPHADLFGPLIAPPEAARTSDPPAAEATAAGRMFWLPRKTLSGSQRDLILASRS